MLSLSSSYWEAHLGTLQKELMSSLQTKGIWLHKQTTYAQNKNKRYINKLLYSVSEDAHETQRFQQVSESGCLFQIDLMNGLSTGLFLDQRNNRLRLPQLLPPSSRVLNLFAYTCSFSVIAAKMRPDCITTNVDISSHSLQTGRNNFMVNGLMNANNDNHKFIVADAMEYSQLKENQNCFDLVICDPPTLFNRQRVIGNNVNSKGKAGITVSASRNFDEIAAAAACAVKPLGYLALFCNCHSLRKKKWLGMVNVGLSKTGRKYMEVEQLQASYDFFEDPLEPDLKGVVYQFLD